MSQFAECFLLVFGQLAAGGVAGLAVPPFAVLERGFYKSSAGIYLGFALLFLAGKVALAVRLGGVGAGGAAEIVLWTGFTVALGCYLATLWGDGRHARARAYVAALFLGMAALVASANAYRLGPLLGPATVLYPAAVVTGALTLGAVGTGMLLGHWYLIDLGLSIEPLRRLFAFFMWVTVLHLAVMLVTVVAMAVTPGAPAEAVGRLWHDHRALVATRLVLGPVAALGIGVLIHRTLAIPQTMAATGLFYVAILAVLVGEMLGRLILFRTSLPL